MNVLDDWVMEMDEEGKVGWTKEGFEELEYNDKVAISVYNLLSQVYNGGLGQYYANGYSFADKFLFEEVSLLVDVPGFREWMDMAMRNGRRLEKLDVMEGFVDIDRILDELDDKFYKDIAEELEEAICQYLKEEWK
jgi:hypothetical protein